MARVVKQRVLRGEVHLAAEKGVELILELTGLRELAARTPRGVWLRADMGLRIRGFFSHIWIYALCLAIVAPAMVVRATGRNSSPVWRAL